VPVKLPSEKKPNKMREIFYKTTNPKQPITSQEGSTQTEKHMAPLRKKIDLKTKKNQ